MQLILCALSALVFGSVQVQSRSDVYRNEIANRLVANVTICRFDHAFRANEMS